MKTLHIQKLKKLYAERVYEGSNFGDLQETVFRDLLNTIPNDEYSLKSLIRTVYGEEMLRELVYHATHE